MLSRTRLHVYIRASLVMYMCSRCLPMIMTSSLHAWCLVACAENPSETVLHFCPFLLNPHFNLEPDYMLRKPTKWHFHRYIAHIEIFSTFHAQVKYISGKNTWFCPLRYNLTSRNSLLLRAMKPKHRTDTVLHFCTFLFNPTSILNLTVIRKLIKRRFQRYIVHTEIFSTFHAWVEYNMSFRPFKPMGLSAHRHTHTQPFYDALVSWYQKKHSPTHTRRGLQSSLVCFLHLLWSVASSPFNLHAWQSFPQSLSKFCLVYLLTWHPQLHTPYISSPSYCILFAARAHTITTCFAVVLRLNPYLELYLIA